MEEEGIYGLVHIVRTHAHHPINGTRVRGRIQESRYENGGSGMKKISYSVTKKQKKQLASPTQYTCATKRFWSHPTHPFFFFSFSPLSLSVDMACAYNLGDGPMCQWAWHLTWPYPLAPLHMREINKSEGADIGVLRPQASEEIAHATPPNLQPYNGD